MNITVVDYKVANIFNIVKGLEKMGATVRVTTSVDDVLAAEKLVLPGVGAYEAGVEGLLRFRLMDPIREIAQKGVPILGICLGAQLLMTEGHEFGVFKGLDLISGTVDLFPATLKDVKVPHIGWNALNAAQGEAWHGTPLQAVGNGSMMYFNHSYYLNPQSKETVLATTTYGGFEYPAVIRKGSIYGCQFHPEKSADTGLSILKNFLAI